LGLHHEQKRDHSEVERLESEIFSDGDALLPFEKARGDHAATGLMCVLLLNMLWDDEVLGVTVTMLGAWGSFFLGNFVNSSGVLAVCTSGVLLAGYSGAYVDPVATEKMKAFWEIVDYVANTMLLGFAGFVVIVKIDTKPQIGCAAPWKKRPPRNCQNSPLIDAA
jgi:hypothetical protein